MKCPMLGMALAAAVLAAGHLALAADWAGRGDGGLRRHQAAHEDLEPHRPAGRNAQRLTDAYPLSDQENKGGWVKFEPMSDEFEGKELDRNKWTLGMEWWKGRQPALFSDKNVTVSDGKLHLTMRKEKLPAGSRRSTATRTTLLPPCTPRSAPATATTRSRPSR